MNDQQYTESREGSVVSIKLETCPFCNASMAIKSNLDCHTLYGNHGENCFIEDEFRCPATDSALEMMVNEWNTRYDKDKDQS